MIFSLHTLTAHPHLKLSNLEAPPHFLCPMKTPSVLFSFLFLPAAWAGTVKLAGLDAPVRTPQALSPSMESKISSRYEDTQCIEFHVEQRKLAAGFLCSSTSADLLTDFGISSDPENSSDARMAQSPNRSFKVNTPMSSYGMTPIKIGNRNLYTADVDCDEANGRIYRATSTCNVAFMPLVNGRFFYSNFVLESHVDSSDVVKKSDIHILWKSLIFSKQPLSAL